MDSLFPYMQARIDALRALGFSSTTAYYIADGSNTRAYHSVGLWSSWSIDLDWY